MFGLVPYSRKNDGVSRRDDFFGIDRFFDDFFRDPFFARVSSMVSPIRADVKENERNISLRPRFPVLERRTLSSIFMMMCSPWAWT
jgi:HSP20 family protein